MFILPAFVAIEARPVSARRPDGTLRGRIGGAWILVGMLLTILIGFRYEVGGDWFSYLRHFQRMEYESWDYAVAQSEFSHWLTNKAMSALGLGMTGVNIVYGAIFSAGFVLFAKSLPRPWLALAIAIPYLIIVVGMGYSRQAVALGFAFIGLVALSRGRFLVFSLWVLVGATFHNSAVLLIPLAGLTTEGNRLRAIAAVAFMSVIGYETLLANKLDRLVDVYVDRQLTDSQGALIRLTMNVVAAALFLRYRKVFLMSPQERWLWSLVAILAVAMWLAYFATGLSTALDRMALYLIPLQIVTFAHLPDAMGRRGRRNTGAVILILAYFAVVQFVWLNFASHAPYWLPYQMGTVD